MPEQPAAGGVDRLRDLAQLLGAVAEAGQHRGDEGAGADAGGGQLRHRVDAPARVGGAGLGGPPDPLVEGADREVDADVELRGRGA